MKVNRYFVVTPREVYHYPENGPAVMAGIAYDLVRLSNAKVFRSNCSPATVDSQCATINEVLTAQVNRVMEHGLVQIAGQMINPDLKPNYAWVEQAGGHLLLTIGHGWLVTVKAHQDGGMYEMHLDHPGYPDQEKPILCDSLEQAKERMPAALRNRVCSLVQAG